MPTIGDIVLVRVDPDANDGTKVVPAIVTRVRPPVEATDEAPATPELISARVQLDSVQTAEWRCELEVTEDLAALDEEDAYRHYQLRA